MKNINLDNSNVKSFTQQDVTVQRKERCFDGFFKIDKYYLQHALYQGGESPLMCREIFERGDAVVVLPYDVKRDAVVLNQQFRPGALNRDYSPWLWEFVAGMFAANENAEQVALRELQEEANIHISADKLHFVMNYLSSPGGTTEQISLYWADVDSCNLGGVFGLEEEQEDILIQVVSRAEAMAMLAAGKINNAATIIGLQWLALNYQQLANSSTAG